MVELNDELNDDLDLSELDDFDIIESAEPNVNTVYPAFIDNNVSLPTKFEVKILIKYTDDIPAFINYWIENIHRLKPWLLAKEQHAVYYGANILDETDDYWFVKTNAGTWLSLGTWVYLDIEDTFSKMLDIYEEACKND